MAVKMAGAVWWITDVTNMIYVIHVHKIMFVSPWHINVPYIRHYICGSLHGRQCPHVHSGPFQLERWELISSMELDIFMYEGKEFHKLAHWYRTVWMPDFSVLTLGWSSNFPTRKLYTLSLTWNKSCRNEGFNLDTLLKVSSIIDLNL